MLPTAVGTSRNPFFTLPTGVGTLKNPFFTLPTGVGTLKNPFFTPASADYEMPTAFTSRFTAKVRAMVAYRILILIFLNMK